MELATILQWTGAWVCHCKWVNFCILQIECQGRKKKLKSSCLVDQYISIFTCPRLNFTCPVGVVQHVLNTVHISVVNCSTQGNSTFQEGWNCLFLFFSYSCFVFGCSAFRLFDSHCSFDSWLELDDGEKKRKMFVFFDAIFNQPRAFFVPRLLPVRNIQYGSQYGCWGPRTVQGVFVLI